MAQNAEKILAFRQWRQNIVRDSRWAVMINADPDALASALALKRLMHSRTSSVDIMRINEITRPDKIGRAHV